MISDAGKLLYISCFLFMATQVIFPTFAFQGVGWMLPILIINIISKMGSLVTLIIFIEYIERIEFVPLIFSLWGVIGVLLAYATLRRYKILTKLTMVNLDNILRSLRNGFDFFVSKLGNGIFSSFGIIAVGLFCAPSVIGFYSIGEKFQRLLDGAFLPVTQALYPYFSEELKLKSGINIIILSRLMIFFVALIVLCSLVSINSSHIIGLIFGEDFLGAARILSIIIFAVPFAFMRSVFMELFLLNIEMSQSVRNITIICTGGGVMSMLLLGSYFGASGVAIGLVSTEFAIAVTGGVLVVSKLNNKFKVLNNE